MLADMPVSLDEKVLLFLVDELEFIDCSFVRDSAAIQEFVNTIFLWRVEVVILDECVEIIVDLKCYILRIDILEREVKYADGPFGIAVVDVHQTTLKGIDWLFQQ